MSNLNKTLLAVGSFLVLALGILETDLFVRREYIPWSEENPVTEAHFRGYPNYLSEFSGAISSYFEYEIIGRSYDSVMVKTLMFPHHSWIRKYARDSEILLRHEQYHFNLSEVFARKFKKMVYSQRGEKIDKKTLEKMYLTHLRELNIAQDNYDSDCDHGLLYERQKDWEYLIDSMLNAYSYYQYELLQIANKCSGNSSFYRSIDTDGKKHIFGKNCVDTINLKYTPHYAFRYKDNRISSIEFYKNQELSIDEYYEVAVIRFVYTEDAERRYFYNPNDQKMRNMYGVFGQMVERDNGKIYVTHIDAQGDPMNDNSGVCKIEWDLDHNGRRTSGTQYDKEGNRVVDRNGGCIITFKYDIRGNLIESGNYNEDYQLSNRNDGSAYRRYMYDEFDNLSAVLIFDENHQLIPDNTGVAAWFANYDLDGNIIMSHYKCSDGSMYIDPDGIAIAYSSYDQYGNVTEEKYYGINKNLIIDENGHGRIQNDYDSLSRLVEIRNFDAYDAYLNDAENKCKAQFLYNNEVQISEKTYFYLDSASNLSHLKTFVYSYDARQNIIEEQIFNEERELLADSSGVCIKRNKYDKQNNLIQVSCYNSNNELQPFSADAVSIRYKYDSNNIRTETTYYDEQNRLTENLEGIAKEKATFNDESLRISVEYFDADNKPTKYDKGVEVVKWTYNSNNQMVREAYYNGRGELTTSNDEIAYFEYTIDHTGTIQFLNFYNKESELVRNENGGIATLEYDYSKEGPVSRISHKDYQGKLRNNQEGFAIENLYYDSNKRIIRSEYLSKLKQSVVISDGYASRQWIYDLNGNSIAEIRRDETNALIEDKDGFAIDNYTYDRNGYITDIYQYGADEWNLDSLDWGDFSSTVRSMYGVQDHYSSKDSRTNVQATYYDNGQKQSEGIYINGKLEGMYFTWYETGQLSGEIEYVNGKRNGLTIDYYNNGQKWREIEYRNGVIIFESEVSWHMNGNIQSRFMNGEELYWDENGQRLY